MVMPADYVLTEDTAAFTFIGVTGERVTPRGQLRAMPRTERSGHDEEERARIALAGHQVILGALDGWQPVTTGHTRPHLADEPVD
jgi:hypothetical protein